MNNINTKLGALGLGIPSILLPQDAYLQKWPVIACDQFTQDREYWDKAKNITAGMPSTLNLIFPEVFLSDGDAPKRIADIHRNMECYLNDGIFKGPKQGFIYIERDTPYQKKRRGLVAALDLEHYDWHPEARPLIRSTEGTVPDRLPPRMDIRRGAPLELPHVLLLIDDDTDSLLPALGELAKMRAKKAEPAYKTDLMMESGSISGWFVDTENEFSFVVEKLEELYRRSASRYASALENSLPFLFAVGDGNHSLASAKGIWEEYKAKGCQADHPCRYALVEIENIYDPAIQFEPIHRVIFGMGFDEVCALLSKLPDFSIRRIGSREELVKAVLGCQLSAHQTAHERPDNRFGIISQGCYALLETSAAGIATACLQPLLDNNIDKADIDYIHDNDEVFRLTDSKSPAAAEAAVKATGILLPPVNKAGLFETVARLGPLPRKSFSMGHSSEKRFYLECRELIGQHDVVF